ncbi:MAG: hypothetical protein ABI704_11950 [Kofleriaceae bacterium]
MRERGARQVSVLLVMTFVVGCHKTYTVDVDAVNELVPPSLKYRVQFVPREIVAGVKREVTYTLPLPKAWNTYGAGAAEPSDKTLEGESWVRVSSSCDSTEPCVAKDWAAEIDQQTRDSGVDVQRDEHGDHRRVVVGTDRVMKGFTVITVSWWRDGATEYHWCDAMLAPPELELAPAFEKACESVAVHQ